MTPCYHAGDKNPLSECPASEDVQTPGTFFAAIRQVESGGRSDAVGDGGRSCGAYQIGRAYWQDACEWGGVDWSYDRYVRDAARCEQVMRWYWQRYVPGAYQRGELEVLSRVHNGGPRGHTKQATLAYWRKIKQALESIDNCCRPAVVRGSDSCPGTNVLRAATYFSQNPLASDRAA